MTLEHLTAEQRAELLAEARAEVAAPAPDGFSIAREVPSPAHTPPPVPSAPEGETREQRMDRLAEQAEQAEGEDFDAFWSAQAEGKRLRNVCGPGNDLVLPRAMPLRFEMESKRLAGREDIEAMKYLFDTLFGDGRWDDLVTRGIDGEQLPVLLLWATLNLSGIDMTLGEARAEAHRMNAEKSAGKEPTPPAALTRGVGSGATSAGTGR